MTMDPAEFKKRVDAFHDIWAAVSLMRKPVIAYDGRIGGVDCIIIGVPSDPEHLRKEVVPLCVIYSPELDVVMEVEATKVSREPDQ